ncbi:MAG: M56 family metallopeptidase [Verrucomicrobiota bacterium]
MNLTEFLIKTTVIFAAAVVSVTLLHRKNPRWRMLISEIACIGILATPILMMAPISIGHSLFKPRLIPTTSAADISGSTQPLPSPAAAEEAVAGATTPALEGHQSSHVLSANSIAIFIYASVVLLLLGRHICVARKLRKTLSQCNPASPETIKHLQRICLEIGIRDLPNLLIVEKSLSPFVIGFRKRTIVIPRLLLDSESDDALDATLRHEVHHLKNRDLVRTTFVQLGATLMWFHPLVWILKRLHTQACEELSDRVAAEYTDAQKYSAMLANLALKLRAVSPTPAAAGFLGSPNILTRLRRLKQPASYNRLSRRCMIAALFASAAAVVVVGFAQQERRDLPTPKLLAMLPEDAAAEADALTTDLFDWMIKFQRDDGSFPSPTGDPTGHDTAITSLAGLAMLNQGGGSIDSKLHEPLMRAVDYVADSQNADGVFVSKEVQSISTYNHFIATTFLASMFDRVDAGRNAKLSSALAPAIGLILDAQKIEKNPMHQGGWRYHFKATDSDLSCTVWAFRALVEAKEAGFEIPDEAFEQVRDYTLRMYNAKSGSFAYSGLPNGHSASFPRAGMGLYILEKLNLGDSDEAKAAAAFIYENRGAKGGYEFYGLGWCALAMAERGGEDGAKFAEWMFPYYKLRKEQGALNGGHGHLPGAVEFAFGLCN